MGALILGPDVQVQCLHTNVANTVVILNDANPADPAGNEAFEVVSSDNTKDKAAGTGALTIGIDYLDVTGAPAHDVVTLNGTTTVPSAFSNYWRVLDAYVLTTGTDGVNAGTITGRKTGAGGDRFRILPSKNRAALGKFTVPLGYQFIFLGAYFQGALIAATTPLRQSYTIEAEVNPYDGTYNAGVYQVIAFQTSGNGRPVEISPKNVPYNIIPALATIRARCITENASGAEVSGSFWGVLRSTA